MDMVRVDGDAACGIDQLCTVSGKPARRIADGIPCRAKAEAEGVARLLARLARLQERIIRPLGRFRRLNRVWRRRGGQHRLLAPGSLTALSSDRHRRQWRPRAQPRATVAY